MTAAQPQGWDQKPAYRRVHLNFFRLSRPGHGDCAISSRKPAPEVSPPPAAKAKYNAFYIFAILSV